MSNLFDVDEFVDLLEKEEDKADMHHSLFSIPSYYKELNPPVVKLKETNHAN